MRQNLYALYYRLLDISALAQLVVFGEFISDRLLGLGDFEDLLPAGGYRVVFAVVSVLAFLVPAILIFQRWMRDEFCEGLWQKAAGSVLKGLVIVPIPLAFVIGIIIYSGGHDLVSVDRPNLSRDDSLVVEAILRTLATAWILTPVIFTFAFHWHRWRASR